MAVSVFPFTLLHCLLAGWREGNDLSERPPTAQVPTPTKTYQPGGQEILVGAHSHCQLGTCLPQFSFPLMSFKDLPGQYSPTAEASCPCEWGSTYLVKRGADCQGTVTRRWTQACSIQSLSIFPAGILDANVAMSLSLIHFFLKHSSF